jgi:hypothetical protein
VPVGESRGSKAAVSSSWNADDKKKQKKNTKKGVKKPFFLSFEAVFRRF